MYKTLKEALEANSLEHKLEMQIKASLDGEQMNEANEVSNTLITDTLSIPNIFAFDELYGKSFWDVKSLVSMWGKISRNHDPKYMTYSSCGTNAGQIAFSACSGGDIIQSKSLKIGEISIIQNRGCKYLRFRPTSSNETFFFFR